MRLKTIFKCLILTLLKNHKASYWKVLRTQKFKFIVDWIVKNTPKLNGTFKLCTRICWILNDYDDFPKCKTDGKYIEIWFHKDIPATHKYPNYCKEHSHNNQEAIQHIKTTLSSFTDEKWKEINDKREEYCLSAYGYRNVGQIPAVIDQISQTISANYGVKRYSQTDEWLQRTIEKNNKKFGKDWYAQTDQYKADIANVFQTVYHENVTCAFQLSSTIEKINQKTYKKYRYDGKIFDSAPEVAFYIWLKDNNVKFIYQPYEKRISYLDQNGKSRLYRPDFYIIDTDQLVEIKGDQFFNNDGTMKNPYDRQYDVSMELKHQCMLANNVKIIRNDEYQQYIVYVNHKYGKDFLRKLKYNYEQ